MGKSRALELIPPLAELFLFQDSVSSSHIGIVKPHNTEEDCDNSMRKSQQSESLAW